MVANTQTFQVFVPIELFVVIVSYRVETVFVVRTKYRHTIATEVRASHGYYVRIGLCHQSVNQITQTAIGIGRNMVKFVNGQQAVSKRLIAEFLCRKAQSSVCANQNFSLCVGSKFFKPFDLALLILCIAQVVILRHAPIGKETELMLESLVKRITDAEMNK